MPKISDFKFEKWIEKRFGLDMVERIKTDPYINTGATKEMMDYLFNNLYDPEFVKTVRLNNALNTEEEAKSVKNERMLELKRKRIELKKEIQRYKEMNEKQDQDIKRLTEGIRNMEEAQSSGDIDNKRIENMLEDSYVNESMQTLKNLEDATKKLSSIETIFESDSRKINRAEVEKILKQAAEKPAEDPSKFPISLKDIPLNNTIGVLNEIVTDEIEKINKLSENFNIENEIQLLKYKTNLALDDSEQSPKTITDAINEQMMEFIQRECEIVNYNNKKAALDDFINEESLKLNELISNADNRDKIEMYLQAYLTYKRAEANYNELRKFYEDVEAEIESHRVQDQLVSEKMKKLEQVAETITNLQETLQNLVDDNSKLMKQPIKMMKLIQEALDAIPEQLRSLNLGSQKTCDNFLVSDFESFRSKVMGIYEAEVASNVCQTDLNDFTALKELIRHQSYKSNGVILNSLEKFLDNLDRVKSEMKENGVCTDSIEKIQKLEALLAKCNDKENRDLVKYLKEFDSRLRSDVNSKEQIDEFEKQMEIWWNQPAVRKCTFPNNTVNGKTLEYFVDIIERCIAQANAQRT